MLPIKYSLNIDKTINVAVFVWVGWSMDLLDAQLPFLFQQFDSSCDIEVVVSFFH
jgi:hypothetical protein